MNLRAFILAALASGCAPAGASGDAASQACAPGRQVSCPCENGEQGAQQCRTDGSGFDECQCVQGNGGGSGQDAATAGSGAAGTTGNGTGSGGTSAGGSGNTGPGGSGSSGSGAGASGGTGPELPTTDACLETPEMADWAQRATYYNKWKNDAFTWAAFCMHARGYVPPDWPLAKCETDEECRECVQSRMGQAINDACADCFVTAAHCGEDRCVPVEGVPFYRDECMCNVGCYDEMNACTGLDYFDQFPHIATACGR